MEEWKKRFARRYYHISYQIRQRRGDVQVSALIYSMGREAENIFKSFTFDDDDFVLAKFDSHFTPKTNIIQERAMFHQKKQNNGESMETFIRSLYELSEKCDFKTTHMMIKLETN